MNEKVLLIIEPYGGWIRVVIKTEFAENEIAAGYDLQAVLTEAATTLHRPIALELSNVV